VAAYDTSIENKVWITASKERRSQESGESGIEQMFRRSLPLPDDLEPAFRAALGHLLRNPGSMVRPRLVLQLAAAYNFETAAAADLATALEYFHTASLVFDDLPCMDNALSRRGSACVHVPFGEASAILAALALINRAYALTWKVLARCPRDTQTAAMEYLEQRLGVNGLLNGQSLDLNYARLPHDRETTERIACGKTVSLIRLTLVLPAMLGGASRREIRLLERMAMCWGLGYQMVDDLKDLLQSSAESGKTAARDQALDRPNIALAIGVPAAVARLTTLIRLGDRMMVRLFAIRPALEFLAKLRIDLETELNKITENACEVMSTLER
jgi:geranylgeranyl pyrophosphate synthase